MMKGAVAGGQIPATRMVGMTLKPTDMLEIQTAIDAYERKFPAPPGAHRRGGAGLAAG